MHQRNIYIKRQLREWRAQNCNPCFRAKSPPHSTDLPVTGFVHRRLVSPVRICGNSGLPLAMVNSLHRRNIYMKRKLREWRAQNVILVSVQKAHLAVRTFIGPNDLCGTGNTLPNVTERNYTCTIQPTLREGDIYSIRVAAANCDRRLRGPESAPALLQGM